MELETVEERNATIPWYLPLRAGLTDHLTGGGHEKREVSLQRMWVILLPSGKRLCDSLVNTGAAQWVSTDHLPPCKETQKGHSSCSLRSMRGVDLT